MCTVTVSGKDGKLLVTMNRDEAIMRSKEIPPQIDNYDLVYPKDSQSNGTWFCVSRKTGAVACLMNRYDEIEHEPENSRGEIALLVLQGTRVEDINLRLYRPFTLILVRGGKVLKYDSNGVALSFEEFNLQDDEGNIHNFHFTSSSLDWDKVLKYREERFVKWSEEQSYRDTIPKIHLDQRSGEESCSTLMKRDDSITKSITQAVLDYSSNLLKINYYYDPNNCFRKKSYNYDLSL